MARSTSQFEFRHATKHRPLSPYNAFPKRHKLRLPNRGDIMSGRKFVLVIGDSHLRAIVDDLVLMPDRSDSHCDPSLAFGFASTPGARSSQLMADVLGLRLPTGLVPDIVCLLAPSNNLEASSSIAQAGVEFKKLLLAALNRWPRVFVLDFPRRIDGKKDQRY